MEIRLVQCKTASSPSRLPGLDRALNPYRGCAHSCAYCYAQDVTRFEMSRPWGECVEAKVNIASKLKHELERGTKGVYGVGTVTDPYQPVESKYELTRSCLMLLRRAGAKVSILTKSDLVLRDIDLLVGWTTAEVGVSIGTADDGLASIIEPSATPPTKRLEALKQLANAGVSTYLMAAPIIRGVSDTSESLSTLVAAASEAGVRKTIWDRFNPKPMASSRLRAVLVGAGMSYSVHSPSEASKVRSILLAECRLRDIDVVDAF